MDAFDLPPIKKGRPAVPVFAFASSSAASLAPPAASPAPPAAFPAPPAASPAPPAAAPAPPAASPAPPAAAPAPPADAATQSSDAESSSSAGSSSTARERSQGTAAAPAESAPDSKAATAANVTDTSAATLPKPAEDDENSAASASNPGSEQQSAPAQGAAEDGKRRGKPAFAELQLGSTQVYGFEAGAKNEAKGKAIALRLEPLKPGLPEFERVLGENRQSVVIGSNRSKVDVNVADDVVSKKHVSLNLIGIKGELALCIIDHSTNGSYVNGTRLPGRDKRFRIRSGDKLTLKAPDLDEDFGWKLDFGNTVTFFTRG
eukprot:TRINITY_DN9605_c0_g2_i1.p1 TRINITY_DN9605_c0_g2~~TRINITY_DN9605_c0_g2_i1.p1  ORF type:complete len:325 (-),score=79.31 TRINITY_DN9605_c0_g2_i1:71-1024(-)